MARDKDARNRLFLGFWKKSIPYESDRPAIDYYDEPHLKRKRVILKKYPDIINDIPLYSRKTKYYTLIITLLMVGSCYYTKYLSNWLFVVLAYFIGGSLSALGGIIIHECGHLLASPSFITNRIYGIIANFTIVFPISASFKKYHHDHHIYLGVKNKDPDLPLDIEIKMVQGSSIMKLIYLVIYPVFYTGRSLMVRKSIDRNEILNWTIQLIYLLFIVYISGLRGLFFLVLSSWFGFSIHPAGAHLIQEHFTFKSGQETYSYYGILNKLFMNIGYHNEHHDFVSVPFEFLPEVTNKAPEFYRDLHSFNSWYGILYTFIVEDVYGPQSRVCRSLQDHLNARVLKID